MNQYNNDISAINVQAMRIELVKQENLLAK